ncbi:MAG: hypothetical protein ACI9B9_002016 [Halioglobus sp.]
MVYCLVLSVFALLPPRPEPMYGQFAIVAALLFVASCAGGDANQSGSYVRHQITPDLSLQTPVGGSFSSGPAIDSFVGKVVVGDLQLELDYGLYSNSLEALSTAEGMTSQQLTIDGKVARLVTSNYMSGVHIPLVRSSSLGNIKLTLQGVTHGAEQRDVALKIFESISFRDPE